MKTVIVLALTAMFFGLAPAMATTYTVDIQNFAFVPHGRHILVGDMITWTNQDAVTHTSTSDHGVWNSGNIAPGNSYSFTFTSAGNFPYHCAIHTSMLDTIFVSTQTGIDEQPSPTPKEFELSQNYPNPFNAQTQIKYTLPQAAHVTIEIYDVLGHEISTLADEEQSAGAHDVIWSAPNFSSGIFFYRVNVDGQSKTGRMVLLK